MRLYKRIIYNSTKPTLPKHIGLEITSRCNSLCIMCSRQYLNTSREPVDIFFDDFKKIITQFNGIKSVQFCGYCESLLNKDIFKMVSYKNDIETVLVSNGKLLNEENSYKLIKSGLKRIHISHHGFTKDEFLKMRGEKCEKVYDEVNSNIKRFVEIKKELLSNIDITINYVLSKVNYSHLSDFIVFAKKLGVDAITPIQLTIINGRTDHLYIDKEFEQAIKDGRKTAKLIGIRFLPFSSLSYGVCREMWNMIQIQSNGNVLPCMGYFPDEASVGNIFEKDINEIWNCEEYVNYRKSVINGVHAKCNNCQLGNPPNRYNIEWLTNRYVRPFIHIARSYIKK